MEPETPQSHLTPEEFRKQGYAVIDWVARYMEEVERYPVQSTVQPGAIRAQLPDHPPEFGDSFDQVMQDLDAIIMPGITHWQSPGFLAYFPSGGSGPAILGDLVSSGLGVQGMLWSTSPACTELETHVLDWLVEMLGLPDTFTSASEGGGVIQDTASSAALCAVLAARERITDNRANREGLQGQLTVYTSNQAHSSIEKAVRIAGIGSDNLRMVDVDESYAMRPDALQRAIAADRSAGRVPCFVCATVGTTSSTAMDPVRAIGEICRSEQLWLHVDAAFAGTAALCPEFRSMQDGLELADSYCFNPHKWMLTNVDCDCFYVADRAALINSLSILPEYLKNKATESGAVFDYRDWQVPLGRRFRALKLWFVIRHYGVSGLQAHIRHHVEIAREFVQWIEEDPDFELMAPAPLSLVCFRHTAGNDFNQQLMERLNATGTLFLTHTKLGDAVTLRLAIGAAGTGRRHIEKAWQLIREVAQDLQV